MHGDVLIIKLSNRRVTFNSLFEMPKRVAELVRSWLRKSFQFSI